MSISSNQKQVENRNGNGELAERHREPLRVVSASHQGLLTNRPAQGFPGRWVGRFIWDDGESVPRHYHLMARRTFVLETAPERARLRIAVCDRYRLYVNGIYAGRGAARITRPQWMPYDTYDVAGLLQAGTNTLSVLAHHYGCPNNYTADLPAGIFVQLDLALPGGGARVVATDGKWRVRAMQGYRRDTPTLNGWHGIADEIFDAAKDPADWMLPGYDDCAWEPAKVLIADLDPMQWAHLYDSPWISLDPRRVPMLRERRVLPNRIVKTAEAIETPLDIATESDVFERLTTEPHVPMEHSSIVDADALVGGTGRATLRGVKSSGACEGRSPVLLLDFGRPLFGCPELTLIAPAAAAVDIFYGNALTGKGEAARPAPDTMLHIGDRLITRVGRQTWQLSDTRQFRYLQIVVRAAAEPVTLERVEFVSLEYPAEARGSFACANPVLTRVWEAGVNTIYLHMEDTHVIDATRERRQYSASQETRGGLRAIYAVYGDRALVEEALLSTKRMQLPDGQLDKYSGSEGHVSGFPPLAYAVNSFSTFQYTNQAWGYALAVRDHYLRFGDAGLLAAHYPALERLREFYETFARDDGLLCNLPGMNFMDWAKHELRGVNFFANAGYAAMLDAMAFMGAELGRPESERASLTERAAAIRAHLRKRHWNEERGLFSDSVMDDGLSPMYSVYTNAYAILLGVADARQQGRIVERVFDPADPLTRPTPLCIGSVAEGLIAAGAVDGTLRMLTEKFGPMIADMDVPTLGEAWTDQAYSGASRGAIHDSPCGIMIVLQERILGVTPSVPGFARCRIEPHLGTLAWARGTVPTPRGDVRVSWDQSAEGVLAFEIEIPPDMSAELVLPCPDSPVTLSLNGREAVADNQPVAAYARLADYTVCIDLPGGVCRGECRKRQ